MAVSSPAGEAGQLIGIAAIGFDAVARPARHLGRTNDDRAIPVALQEEPREETSAKGGGGVRLRRFEELSFLRLDRVGVTK
jgi:hypothetical protein